MIFYLIIAVVSIAVIAWLILKPKTQKPQEIVQVKPQVEDLIPINIYFGSQQGTAAKFAKILSEEGREVGFITNDVDLNDCNWAEEMSKDKVGIFCLATHGEGDPTDNAKKFNEWLWSDIKVDGFRFAVFGLGNTQYEHYNKMGRDSNARLEARGGIRIFKYGEGDDNSSLEEDFNEWKKTLFSDLKVTLDDLINKNKIEEPALIKQHSQKTEIATLVPSELSEISLAEAKGEYDFQTKNLLKAVDCPIESIEELRQNTQDGSTLLIKIDLSATEIQYKTAMNLGVYPINSESDVQLLADILGQSLDSIFKWSDTQEAPDAKRKKKLPFPSHLSLRTILSRFCDFKGQIMKKTLTELAKLTDSQEYKTELEQLAIDKTLYAQQIESHKQTLLGLLQKYKIKPTLTQFVHLCPRISPRLFTIASSNLKYPRQIQIADSLLIDTLPDGTKKIGLCSQYFLDQIHSKKPQVRIDFRESSFKLPENEKADILMIGPGTGVAPFIAFSQERESLLQNQLQKQNQYVLYFGCRHSSGDFIYRDQLQNYEQTRIIDKFNTAFSRDQDQKVYVQDLLRRDKEFIHALHEVSIFICGSTQMGHSVMTVLQEIFSVEIIEQMEKAKRLVKELW